MLIRCLLAGLLCVSTHAQGESPSTSAAVCAGAGEQAVLQAEREWRQQITADLLLRSDANSRAVAVLFAEINAAVAARQLADQADSQASELHIEQAAAGGLAAFEALWPQRDAVPWSLLYPSFLQLRQRMDEASAERWHSYLIKRGGQHYSAYALQLAKLEAEQAPDESIDALLEDAARNGQPDAEMHYDGVRQIAQAMSRTPPPPALRNWHWFDGCRSDARDLELKLSERAVTTSLAVRMQMALVSLDSFPSRYCPRSALLSPEREAACLTLGRRLAKQAPTLMQRAVAAGIWHRLSLGTDEEAQALQTRRQLRWWMEEGLRQYSPDGRAEVRIARTEALLEWMLSPGSSEIEGLRHALREAGLEDAPPEAWMPVNPESLQP